MNANTETTANAQASETFSPLPGTGTWTDAKVCSHCGMKVRDFWPSGQGCYVFDHSPHCAWLASVAGQQAVQEVYKVQSSQKMRHTPGPWKTKGAEIFDGLNQTPIAKAYHIFYRRGDQSIISPEANARLMAAAPALLQAVQELYALPDLHERVKTGSVRYMDALAHAREAIQAALG